MPPNEGRTVAVIGLGAMGYGMAGALARAGFRVTGCDARPEVVARFTQEHGRGTATPADAARGAEAVVTVVVNAEQTERVLLGPGGAAAASAPDAVMISCATMAPDRARALAGAVADLHRSYVDAPMSGGSVKASEGQLTVLASGQPAAMDKAEAVLGAMAAQVHRLGDEAGIAAAFKMVNQLLAGVHIAAACEAVVFARKLGLDLDKVYEVITGAAGNSWMFENRVPHILAGDYTPRSAVDIFTKDLGIVGDMARAEQFPTPIAGAALQMFLMAAAAGMGRDDDASVARLYAEVARVTLPGPA